MRLSIGTKTFFVLVVSFLSFCSCNARAQSDSTKVSLRNYYMSDSAKAWFHNYYLKYLDRALAHKEYNYVPPNGIIPDSSTAIKVSVVILSKIYGRKRIESEKPFTAILKGGYWIVYGSLPEHPDVMGVAEIVIKKKNGEVINVSHGK